MRLDELFNYRLDEDGRIVQGVNTTQDVKPGETKRQAVKFGNDVSPAGIPPTIRTDGKFKAPKTS